MKVKIFVISFLSLFLFSFCVFYNYQKVQDSLKNQKPSIIAIENVVYPIRAKTGVPINISWFVEAPSGFTTPFTTIYYGYESSPSALLEIDSPQAVGYPYHLPDYESGVFYLPQLFSLSITPENAGVVYFRSYAEVNHRHYWSEEKNITILK